MKTFLKAILAILAVIAVSAFEPGHEKESYIFSKFQAFLKEHNKKYTTIEEYTARFNVFKVNYEKMEAFTLSDKPKSHTVGITKFSDLTPQEFRNTYLNLKVTLLDQIKAQSSAYQISGEAAPAVFDWRNQGVIGSVKDQGSCGSCWAFSTVANLEGLFAIKTKNLINLSEQQLVDCDKDQDQGCNGGLMENALQYVEKNGLALSADYKYTARDGSCKASKVKSVISVKGHHFSPDQDEENIKKMLVETGPLSIAINADPLQFYNGGIIDADASECDPQGLNHGVAIVGYGSENGKAFWVIRNSWGSTWGEKGYVRFALGNGVCGVNTYVITAELA